MGQVRVIDVSRIEQNNKVGFILITYSALEYDNGLNSFIDESKIAFKKNNVEEIDTVKSTEEILEFLKSK